MNGSRTTWTLAGVSLLGISGLCTAAERSVPNDYSTIQGAINAASDGDVIVVGPGTYYESLDLDGKELTLRSTAGASSTVIDGSNDSGPVVLIEGSNGDVVTIDGFTLRGGSGRLRGFEYAGGGLFVKYMEVDVSNCVFTDNHCNIGGGAWLLSSDAVFRSCDFRNNSAIGAVDGGGGLFASQSTLEMSHCRFEHNDAEPAGGGMLALLSDSSVRTSVFVNNEAPHGAGMTSIASDAVLAGCTFRNNIASDVWQTNGGGFKATNGGTAWITSSVFWENVPSQVIALDTSDVSVHYSFVMDGWDGPGFEVSSDDPKFDGASLELLPGSPCVDAGDHVEFNDPGEVDFAGHDRVIDGDEDGDMIVDAGAYELIGNWIEAGACCFSDGTCQYSERSACETSGGSFLGAFVDCEGAECEQPEVTGACCLGSSCEALTEEDCLAASGVWAGADVACSAASCDDPNGACCLAGGFCLSAPREMCELSGGTWMGAHTTCGGGICDGDPPATGACCLGSSCSTMTRDECDAADGLYQGDDVPCSAASCPCDGDLDQSYDVGFSDLVMMLDSWGGCAGCAADLDGSGDVGFDDLVTLLLYWGPCS